MANGQLLRCDCDCAAQVDPCTPCVVCPPTNKMLIPPLTEATGIWFASLAAAAAAFANPKLTSGCIGYQSQASPSIASFSATDGPFTLTGQGDTDTGTHPLMWGSLNLVSGSVLSCAYDIFAGLGTPLTTTITVRIYNNVGVLLQTLTATGNAGNVHLTGTLNFTPVGYTGRFIVYAEIAGPSSDIQPPGSFAFTSNNTTTTNLITALYDTGAMVPSCLDCS